MLAASIAYAAPAVKLVDDVDSGMQQTSTGQDSGNVGAIPGTNSAVPSSDMSEGATGAGPTTAMNNTQMPSDTGMGTPSDDMSADTATGDDDY